MIAFYYGLTGFACVWFYRKTMSEKPRDILMQGIIPLLGGLLLRRRSSSTRARPTPTRTTATRAIGGIGGVFVIGIGSLLLGVVLMFVWQCGVPDYFRGETLPKRHSGDLVLLGIGPR